MDKNHDRLGSPQGKPRWVLWLTKTLLRAVGRANTSSPNSRSDSWLSY